MVNLINRYFVPLHLDNTNGSARRYGMEPGHENAYILFETPEIPGGPKVETVILGRLSQVLVVENARLELLKFLKRHPELKHPWPELQQLEGATDPEAITRRAELLIEEGEAEAGLKLLRPLSPTTAVSLLRARALRMRGAFTDAQAVLDGLPRSADIDLERIRLSVDRKRDADASARLGEWLAANADHPQAGEAFYLRGWLHHLAGQDELATTVWESGIARHPPERSLFSQKARLTVIRENWQLPANVDQPK